MKATWWVQATPGTTHVRCTIPARHLPGQVLDLSMSDLVEDEFGEPFMPRHQGPMSIWQFPGNATRALCMMQMQELGFMVLVEVDDNYMIPPPHVPYVRSHWKHKIDPSGKTDYHSYEAHRKIVDFADGVICATSELAERYARRNPNVFHCPNSLDLADWEEPWWTAGEKLHIGYAGSDSHRYDLSLVERALDWASWQSDAEVWKLGASTAPFNFKFQQVPWANDVLDYYRNLRVLDVGLCPLKRSDWHDCKSDIKAIEYTLAGVLPIVQQDAPAYADWVNVVPSATTEKDWLKRVKWAVKNPGEVEAAWREALAFVKSNKLIQHHIDKWSSICE